MIRKRLTASAVSLALLLTTAFCGLSTPVHAAEADTNNTPAIVEDDTEFVRDSETGHISIVNDNNGYVSKKSGKITPNAALPASYGNIATLNNSFPATRDQGVYGTCWAHAAAATAEFDLVQNHGLSKSSADFSELQLAWLHYNTGTVLPGLDGDEIYIPSYAPKDYLDVGGNIYYSMQTLAQWKCFTYESNLPYSSVKNNKSYYPYTKIGNWSNDTYRSAAQLKNVRMLNIKKDPAAVKQAIMDYGAVYISYNSDSRYYNTNTYTYYYHPDKDVGTNHDVVIVGWDDNVAASKFSSKARPSSKGAWLVRNSWSTSSTNYGSANSYFYMSYEDATLAETAYALDFEKYWQDDNIYQYDGATTHNCITASAVANVFTANTSMSRSSEKLDSVMVSFMYDEDVPYKIEVYTDPTGSDPRSGKLVASQTGRTTAKGIYTIDLNEDVFLFPGQKFSVVVSSSNGSSRYFDIEASQNVTYGTNTAWFNSVASADKGESLIYYSGRWSDATNYSGCGNVCVKAITSDNYTKKYDIIYELNGGTNNSNNPTEFLSSQSGSGTLYDPVKSGYHFVGWFSDQILWNKVTEINYNEKKDQIYYAGWCKDSNDTEIYVYSPATTEQNGSYAMVCSGCGLVKSTGTSYMISSATLNKTSFAYDGKTKSPVPVIKTFNGDKLQNGIDYTYYYNQANRSKIGKYSLTVEFIGKYGGDPVTLDFNIVNSGPASAGAKLYGFNDIKVTWSKVSGASGYRVYYKKSTAAAYKNYKTTKNLSLKFADLAGNTKYNFKVVPTFKDGRQAGSKIVSATTLKKLNQPTFEKIGPERVSLYWQSITAATGYQVWWSTAKNGKYQKLCDFSANEAGGVSFNVPKNQKYWYKTRAYRTVNGKKIFAPYSVPKAYTLR